MIYDARCDDKWHGPDECVPGSVRFPGQRCETYDANGQRAMYVLWCDTETGELDRYVVDKSGSFERGVNGRLVKIQETRAAPLVVKVIDEWCE